MAKNTESKRCQTDSCIAACQPIIKEQTESLVEKLLRILDEHEGFYTLHEVGPAYHYPLQILHAVQHPGIQRKVLPYYYKLMKQGEYSKHGYVSKILELERLEEKGIDSYPQAGRDSLCLVYGCRHVVDSVTQQVIISD